MDWVYSHWLICASKLLNGVLPSHKEYTDSFHHHIYSIFRIYFRDKLGSSLIQISKYLSSSFLSDSVDGSTIILNTGFVLCIPSSK